MDLSLSRHQRRFGAALRFRTNRSAHAATPLRTAKMGDREKAVRATKCCSRYPLCRPDHLRKRRGTAPPPEAFPFYINDLDMCGGGKEIRNARLESCNPRKSRDNIVPHRSARSVSQTFCQALSPYRETSCSLQQPLQDCHLWWIGAPPTIALMMHPSPCPLRTAEIGYREKVA